MNRTEEFLEVELTASCQTGTERILERLSYKVVSESSSVKALEIFRPGMPIIICTGFSTKVPGENAGEHGISISVRKPCNKKSLAKAVREVLDAKLAMSINHH